jgi:hypothetical protein
MAAGISGSFGTLNDAFLYLCKMSSVVEINPAKRQDAKLHEAIDVVAKNIFQISPEKFKRLYSSYIENEVIAKYLESGLSEKISQYVTSSRRAELFQTPEYIEAKDSLKLQQDIAPFFYTYDQAENALHIDVSKLDREHFLQLLDLIPLDMRKSVKVLLVKDASKIRELSPKDFRDFISLLALDITNCTELRSFAEGEKEYRGQENLRKISFINTVNLHDISGISAFENLDTFIAKDARGLLSLQPLFDKKLKHLELSNCHDLFSVITADEKFVEELEGLQKGIERLSLTDMPSFFKVKALENFRELKKLDLSNIGATDLQDIPFFPHLETLVCDSDQEILPSKVRHGCVIEQVPSKRIIR